MRTIRESATEIGVTPAAIYKHLKRLTSVLNGHTEEKAGIKYIDDIAFKILQNNISKSNKPNDTVENGLNNINGENERLKVDNASLSTQIIEVQARIAAQDSEIQFLRGELQSQRDLTRNMQVLLKNEQDRHRGLFSRLFLPQPKD